MGEAEAARAGEEARAYFGGTEALECSAGFEDGRFQVRRQHVIGPFIVDFLCSESKLVVEVDGPIHQMTAEYDSLRQEFLESLGFQVLRVTNDEVLKQLDEVGGTIIRHLTTPPP